MCATRRFRPIVHADLPWRGAGGRSPCACLAKGRNIQGEQVIYTKKGRDLRLGLSAPPEVELLNLWRDFRKVVDFIDENQEWLKQ